jgi:hypothetical protein
MTTEPEPEAMPQRPQPQAPAIDGLGDQQRGQAKRQQDLQGDNNGVRTPDRGHHGAGQGERANEHEQRAPHPAPSKR